ncbi:hypothetical protein [Segatella salivae]|uniref:hypothetical protein n=1 Tax=Segatella salivae TaxID=228604 RepID=UPI002420446F|nr:hypothetical protein [Segatella salivae]
MTNIRKVRKAFYHKYGIKTCSIRIKPKKGSLRFTPTMRKILRRDVTEFIRTNFLPYNVH